MKKKIILIGFILNLLCHTMIGQTQPQVNLTYSKLLATYDFIQKLSEGYPENKFKQLFKSSKYHQPHFLSLIQQLDTLNTY